MSSASTAYISVPTPVGDILVVGTERGICALIIAAHAAIPSAFDALQHYCPALLVADADALVEATIQLTDYLNGARQVFNLPLDLVGTLFQRRV